jgi:putative ABC transport system permease protein
VTRRDDVERTRAAAPLPAALRGLAAVSTAVLVVLAVLALLLGTAASARDRGETLARLRTLGLRRRDAWRVALGELLPGALAATLGGLAVGVLLARACLGPLSVRLVTGQSSEPALVVPWWSVVPALLVVSSLLIAVAVESSARRRQRLGLVLRAGGT